MPSLVSVAIYIFRALSKVAFLDPFKGTVQSFLAMRTELEAVINGVFTSIIACCIQVRGVGI